MDLDTAPPTSDTPMTARAPRLAAVVFLAAVLASAFALIPARLASADVAYDSYCRLVPYIAGTVEPPGSQITYVGADNMVPYAIGATATRGQGSGGGRGGGGAGASVPFTYKFASESCTWTFQQSATAGGWHLGAIAQLAQESAPTPTNANILQLTSGLEFYALIFCMVAICLSAILWAVGSKGQNPGQELTGRRGLIVAVVTAFFIGAIPAVMSYLDKEAQTAQTIAVSVGNGSAGNSSTAASCQGTLQQSHDATGGC